MDRKQLLSEMYSNNKLDFSGDEEELMKSTGLPPEMAEQQATDSAVSSATAPASNDESKADSDQEQVDDDESFECEDEEEYEDEEDDHEITMLKDEDSVRPVPDLPKSLVNRNLNLNRGTAKNKNVYPATPAIIKRKQAKAWFNSPTDSCLSPCTQKIFKSRKPL